MRRIRGGETGRAAPEAGLEVLRLAPQGEVKSFTRAEIAFSQPMTELEPFDRADQSLLALDPPVPGEVVWLDRSTLGFVADRPLSGSLSVTVRLSPDIRSLSGASLSGDPVEFGFTLPPWEAQYVSDVIDVAPETAWRPVVNVTFNQRVDMASLEGSGFFVWGPEEAPMKIPTRWCEHHVPLKEYGGRMFRAAAAVEVPGARDWRLVVAKGASPGAGLLPLSEDLEIASGTTPGDLEAVLVLVSRWEGEGSARTAVLENDVTFAEIRFSNPVMMSEAAGYIEVRPAAVKILSGRVASPGAVTSWTHWPDVQAAAPSGYGVDGGGGVNGGAKSLPKDCGFASIRARTMKSPSEVACRTFSASGSPGTGCSVSGPAESPRSPGWAPRAGSWSRRSRQPCRSSSATCPRLPCSGRSSLTPIRPGSWRRGTPCHALPRAAGTATAR
jgi:hypothetical protein